MIMTMIIIIITIAMTPDTLTHIITLILTLSIRGRNLETHPLPPRIIL